MRNIEEERRHFQLHELSTGDEASIIRVNPAVEEMSPYERYYESTRFLREDIHPYPNSSFSPEIAYPITFWNTIEKSILQGDTTLVAIAGPAGAGKSTFIHEAKKLLFDSVSSEEPADGLIPKPEHNISRLAQQMNATVVNVDFQWGDGYEDIPLDERVSGDYYADPELYGTKKLELERVESSLFGEIRTALDLIERIKKEGKKEDVNILAIVTLDQPLFTGVTTEDGSTVGMVRALEQTRNLMHKTGPFEGLQYSPYFASLFPTTQVRTFTREMRKLIEQVDDLNDARRIMIDNGINIMLSDEEAEEFIRRAARVGQTEGLEKDYIRLIAHKLNSRKIEGKLVRGGVSEKILANNPSVVDDLLGEMMRNVMEEDLRLPPEASTIFTNDHITRITLESVSFPIVNIRPLRDKNWKEKLYSLIM